MNIQHSQQIQHIRYAKQYTQFARRPATRRGSRGRRFGIAFTAIAAMVGFTGVAFSSSAHAQRPTEGASIPTTASRKTRTWSHAVFPRRRRTDRGVRSRSVRVHPYLRCARQRLRFQGRWRFRPKVPRKPASTDGCITPSHRPKVPRKPASTGGCITPSTTSAGTSSSSPPAETDGWAHHVEHVQVPGEPDVATDGWAHHTEQGTVTARKPAVNFIEAPTTEGSNWRNCFTAEARPTRPG